ncbi:MAG TPA: mechanosensitive ion channel family protein [Trichocoleus sp.]
MHNLRYWLKNPLNVPRWRRFGSQRASYGCRWQVSPRAVRLNFQSLGSAALLVALLLAASPTWGQAEPPTLEVPGLNNPLRSSLVEPEADGPSIATADVRLDGYSLFAIAAPTLATSTDRSTTPIRERVRGIERTLGQIASSNFDPEALEVESTVDPSSNLPVITINDQYLMTVTTLDAQLQVQTPERWAGQLTGIIERALVRAHQERQIEYLTRQSLIASGIILAVLLGSWVFTAWQRHFSSRQKRLEANIPADAEIAAGAADEPALAAAALNRQGATRRRRNQNDLKRRLLQVGQIGLWGGGLFLILGLFPYSRWLQPLLFSAPLKIVTIGLGIYILIRISDLVIDRFTAAFARGELVDPEASQRLSLRVSTFSRVLKSGAGVIWIVIGILGGLSVVGVDLVPLLAGAGLIGLAISFAAQSLIKDMINGILILFEDQYAVGDVIVVGEVSGFVENMNLRITQLRDSEGQLITVPNSTIEVVQNLSKDWSRVDLTIDLAYGTDPNHALGVIHQLSQELYSDPQWQPKMLEPPEVLGIDSVTHSGILVRVWIKTLPLQQWVVGREFRRRLALVLDQHGLAIGVPQQSLWFRSGLDLDLHRNGHRETPPKLRTSNSSHS